MHVTSSHVAFRSDAIGDDAEGRLTFDLPDGGVLRLPLARLWRLANEPRAIDPRGIRVSCSLLLFGYLIASIVRLDPAHPEFVYLRVMMSCYVAAGIVWAYQFTWREARLYVVTLAHILALSTTYMMGVRGSNIGDLSMAALTTFIPMVFLVTASDMLLTVIGLALGHATMLAWFPAGEVGLATRAVVLGGSLLAGTAAGLLLITYRSAFNESLNWWRATCKRERILRECAEIAARQSDVATLLDEFCSRFQTALQGSRCLVVLNDLQAGLAASLSDEEGRSARLEADILPATVSDLVQQIGMAREAMVRQVLSPDEQTRLSQAMPVPFFQTHLFGIPVTFADGHSAASVLLSVADGLQVEDDDLKLWRAMADQLGIALEKVRLVTKLQQALNAKNEFVNTMSHELRSPLNVIIGYADMVNEGEVDPSLAAARIRLSATELLQLVEHTMAAARLGSGKVRLHLEDLQLTEHLGDLAENLRALPEASDPGRVSWNVDPSLPSVRLDGLKLKEIVQNLVSNALKHANDASVAVHVQQHDGRLRVEVADTGPGIPLEAQARIFDMFERVEWSDRPAPPGAGLGLYIVKRLVEAMQGTIGVVSSPGSGSRFIVNLPLRLDDGRDVGHA